MTDTDNLVLEQLRAIRETLDRHSDALAGLRVEIAAMGQQLGALTTAVHAGHDRTPTEGELRWPGWAQ